MLKYEQLTVEVEGFGLAEVNAEESADFYDDMKQKYSKESDRKFMVTFSRELFVKRLKSWPIGEDCNKKNKREFFNSYTAKCTELISSAEGEIKKKRGELLGNLLSGASGT